MRLRSCFSARTPKSSPYNGTEEYPLNDDRFDPSLFLQKFLFLLLSLLISDGMISRLGFLSPMEEKERVKGTIASLGVRPPLF